MADLQRPDTLPMPSLSSGANDRKLPRRPRRVHHKVKTGCKACKIRRQKCDERRPQCSGCGRHSTECWYQVYECPQSERVILDDAKSRVNTRLRAFPTNYLPISPSTELNLDDLELLHQFLMSTCVATGQLPEMTVRAQKTILPLAQAYPFVMYGSFAMAATHLSCLRPSRQAHYAMVATKNHQIALPNFQVALENLNRDNCEAVIFFSKSLLWCSLAVDGSPNDIKFAETTEDHWLPQWFYLLRGSCQIVESCRTWIKDGPHIQPKLDNTIDYTQNTDDQQISALMFQLQLMTESTLCKVVLATLREAFARASVEQHNTPLRNAINFWIGSLPDVYIKALGSREPWTMVVLAHFCVLIHRLELSMFMKGHATRLVLAITENLDAKWKRYVEWPHKELGFRHTTHWP